MNSTSKFGLCIAVAGYASAWFAVVDGNYLFALAYGIIWFIIWMVSLELHELVKND